MDLLKKLLMKNPKDRLMASEALKHPAFTYIQDKIPNNEQDEHTGTSSKAPNLKDFHEKYKFDIKQFPKAKANIPDSIHDLNTPMTAPDDKRAIKQMNIQHGLTPQLAGRSLDPTTTKPIEVGMGNNTGLGPIKEENVAKNTKKNLRGMI